MQQQINYLTQTKILFPYLLKNSSWQTMDLAFFHMQ